MILLVEGIILISFPGSALLRLVASLSLSIAPH